MSLSFTGVDIRLGGSEIVRDAAGAFEAGTVTCLLGPNGAGKSTLLRGLAGLVPLAAGSVTVDGSDLLALGARRRARLVATVPQHPGVDLHFTAREVVTMGRHAHVPRFGVESAADHAAVEGAFAAAGVAHLAERDTATLSGGERQLVFVAKAIAQDTPVLLLDEPISALDIRHQLAVLTLLRRLADEGRTVVAALHDLDLAARVSDHALVLHRGRVHAAGAPADVITPDLMRDVFGVEAEVRHDPHGLAVTALAPVA